MADRLARADCGCSCGCTCSRAAGTKACVSCLAGYHRPSEIVRAHLRRGTETWIRLMPPATGSSGLSDAQLQVARDAWLALHGRYYCPVTDTP